MTRYVLPASRIKSNYSPGKKTQQPSVSTLIRNRAGAFSVERLMVFLTALDQDVEFTIRPRREHGGVSHVM